MRRLLTTAMAAAVLVLAACEAIDKQARTEYEAATKKLYAGEHQAAVAQFVSLVKDHPFSPHADNALYWVGVTQFLYLGETERALQTLGLLIRKYPRRDSAPPAQLYIAEIYELGYNDYARAIEEYRKAARYADREIRERSLYSLADNLFRIGKTEEAQETWLLQVREFPEGGRADIAHYRLGTTAYSRGSLGDAEAHYRKALAASRDPEIRIKAKFALAQCLEASEHLKDALAVYRDLEPDYANKNAIQIKIKALETRILKKSY